MKMRKQKSEMLRPCSAKKFASCTSSTEEEDNDKPVAVFPGIRIPLPPSNNHHSSAKVVFVLEKASLVLAYVGKKYVILNPDKHADFLRKKNMNPYDYRPDIIHEVLGKILDSRLNMSGRIEAIYLKTDLGLLIKIDPRTRIPPTLGKFCAMMAQLLQEFSIKARGKGGKLMRLIDNPLDQHLPINSQKIGFSRSSEKAVRLCDYVASFSNIERTPVFVIGAMAHGKINNDDNADLRSISEFPLSAGVCARCICYELERQWKIL